MSAETTRDNPFQDHQRLLDDAEEPVMEAHGPQQGDTATSNTQAGSVEIPQHQQPQAHVPVVSESDQDDDVSSRNAPSSTVEESILH